MGFPWGVLLFILGLSITVYVWFNPGILGFEQEVIIPGQFILGVETTPWLDVRV